MYLSMGRLLTNLRRLRLAVHKRKCLSKALRDSLSDNLIAQHFSKICGVDRSYRA
jgi:hypothetical protein